MKTLRRIIYLIFLLVFLNSINLSASDAWENYVAGGKKITAIAREDSLIWVGTDIGLVCINQNTGETLFYDQLDGLPYPAVTAIVIDKQKNKWIGTGDMHGAAGLVKFDGTTWQVFDTENSGLHSNYIQMLFMDKNGVLWIGNGGAYQTFGGVLTRYDGTDWFTYDEKNSALPYNKHINVMRQDSLGNYWIGTNGGLVKFDGENWQIFTVSNSGLPAMQVFSIAIDGIKKWIGNFIGLTCYDDSVWITYTHMDSPLPKGRVNSLALDSSKNLWIGAYYGLAEFTGTEWAVYSTKNSGLPANKINSILIDGEENKWIGTDNGLVKFDNVNWKDYKTSENDLPVNYISTITIDKNDVKWIGTDGWGLTKYDDDTWVTYDSSNCPLSSNLIKAVSCDSSGNLWVSVTFDIPTCIDMPCFSFGPSLFKFDGTNWTAYDSSNSVLSGKFVLSVAVTSDNVKWFGTNKGLVKYDGSQWQVYNTENDSLCSDNITSLCAVDTTVWLGSDCGLMRFDGREWLLYNTDNSGLPSNCIKQIEAEDNNQIWIATDSGLVKYDGTEWQVFTPRNSGLPNNSVTALHIHNGVKWIGCSYAGLVCYNDDEWRIFNTENSDILSNEITSISSDSKSNIWIATFENGISRLNPEGIVENIADENSAIKASNFHLSANYPNPFNSKTILPITIPYTGFVSVDLYNTAGQKIRRIYAGKMSAGMHKLPLDMGHLSSGIYFYSVKFGSKIQFGKMIFIK